VPPEELSPFVPAALRDVQEVVRYPKSREHCPAREREHRVIVEQQRMSAGGELSSG
jgi:hypothetical protein